MSKPFNHIEPGTPEYKKQLLKSQGEIKEDNSLNTLMRTWSKNNPKLSNAINIIPIIGTIKQGLEHGFDIKTPAGHFNVNSPFIKSLGGDVLTLLGIGQAAKAIGWFPAAATEAYGTAAGVAGNLLGQHLDEKFDTKLFTPTLTIVGGVAGGVKGYKNAQQVIQNAPEEIQALGPIKNNMVSKEFVADAAADMLESTIKNTNRSNPKLTEYTNTRFNTTYPNYGKPTTAAVQPYIEEVIPDNVTAINFRDLDYSIKDNPAQKIHFSREQSPILNPLILTTKNQSSAIWIDDLLKDPSATISYKVSDIFGDSWIETVPFNQTFVENWKTRQLFKGQDPSKRSPLSGDIEPLRTIEKVESDYAGKWVRQAIKENSYIPDHWQNLVANKDYPELRIKFPEISTQQTKMQWDSASKTFVPKVNPGTHTRKELYDLIEQSVSTFPRGTNTIVGDPELSPEGLELALHALDKYGNPGIPRTIAPTKNVNTRLGDTTLRTTGGNIGVRWNDIFNSAMEDKYPVIKHVKSILSELGPDENIKRFYELDPSIRTEFNNVVRELLNASSDNYFNRLSKRAYKVRNKFPQLSLSVYGVDPVGDYPEATKLLRNGWVPIEVEYTPFIIRMQKHGGQINPYKNESRK